MGARFERWHPIVAAGVTAVAYCAFVPVLPIRVDYAPSLFSAIISVAAIAVGFLATAKSILLSIDNKPLIVALKKTGTYPRLVSYLFEAVLWAMVLAALSTLCFLIDLKPEKDAEVVSWNRWLFGAWVAAIIGAGASFLRVMRLFGKILKD